MKSPSIVILAALVLAACSGSSTAIVVRVDSDIAPVTQLQHVQVAITGPGGTYLVRDFDLLRYTLPGTIVLTQGGSSPTVYIVVTGYLATGDTVAVTYTANFQPGRDVVVDAFLGSRCVDVRCAGGATCGRCGCESSTIQAYADYDPDASLGNFDAGITCPADCGLLASDASNCGHCGTICPDRPNAPPTCAHGQCVVSCAQGFGDCDHNAANGCEVSFTSNGACGGCNRVCSSGLRETCMDVSGTGPRCCQPIGSGTTCQFADCGSTMCVVISNERYCCR